MTRDRQLSYFALHCIAASSGFPVRGNIEVLGKIEMLFFQNINCKGVFQKKYPLYINIFSLPFLLLTKFLIDRRLLGP